MNHNSFSAITPATLQQLWHTTPHLIYIVPTSWWRWHLHLLMSHGSPSACDANETSWTQVLNICYTLYEAPMSTCCSKWYRSPRPVHQILHTLTFPVSQNQHLSKDGRFHQHT
jgi:hypothetical protein